MGNWLEVLTARTPDAADYESRRSLLVGEIAPVPLMTAGSRLPHEHRGQFPMLDLVRERSAAYTDEQLWLDAPQAGALLDELWRLRRICHREESLRGLDGPLLYDSWRDGWSPERFEPWLDHVEGLLQQATATGCWVLLSL